MTTTQNEAPAEARVETHTFAVTLEIDLDSPFGQLYDALSGPLSQEERHVIARDTLQQTLSKVIDSDPIQAGAPAGGTRFRVHSDVDPF